MTLGSLQGFNVRPRVRLIRAFLIVFALPTLFLSVEVRAQGTGWEVYEKACLACHGFDGTGMDASTLGFDLELPDFTDCRFAQREADGDWLAVVHDGGPARAFDRMMPAFREALSIEEMQMALDHVRTFCQDDDWPRGELNLPRALVTEKAFPEDETVLEFSATTEGQAAWTPQLVYERRFGPRTQIELVVPYRIQERDSGSWHSGVGDFAVAVKHALFHSINSGSIFSAGTEVVLPTGHAERGFGEGVTVFEPFVAFGQLLPSSSFFQFQGGFAIPADWGRSNEVFWRTVVGKTLCQGFSGRSWTPMVELLGAREIKTGDTTKWDLVPELQVSLSQRQHILLNVGVRIPINDIEPRTTQIQFYLLWDLFDGGFLEGW